MKVIGMMSGTSLDGIDLVLCSFTGKGGKWKYTVLKAETVTYNDYWIKVLSNAPFLNAEDFVRLHNEFGRYIGTCIRDFLGNLSSSELIASHGHTIFHQPGNGITFQLGNGSCIAAESLLPVVSDFRSTDVALGGQGAPLVPVGDKLLFGDYDFCLNLGGFANISNDHEGQRIAFDICPVNIIANMLSNRLGVEFDRDGMLGSKGTIISSLVDELDALDFYRIRGPKSLGREWVEQVFIPVLSKHGDSVPDLLRSFYEHASRQIANYLNSYSKGSVLVTGGGTFNKFLVELIKSKTHSNLVVPDQLVVKYKEAIIFAFLGMLRYQNRINCLSSVTGARKDSSAGSIYLP